MSVLVIEGSQWGDEGKGKITDYLGQYADVVVRSQGGNNAGHTITINGEEILSYKEGKEALLYYINNYY